MPRSTIGSCSRPLAVRLLLSHDMGASPSFCVRELAARACDAHSTIRMQAPVCSQSPCAASQPQGPLQRRSWRRASAAQQEHAAAWGVVRRGSARATVAHRTRAVAEPTSHSMSSRDVPSLKKLRLITAVKTPYLPNGKFDLRAYDRIIEHQIRNGVEGVIVGGTTGEGQLMSWDEHIMLIAHTVNTFGDDLVVVGNTGSNSTREALHATEQGFAVGMHAALQINPYYVRAIRALQLEQSERSVQSGSARGPGGPGAGERRTRAERPACTTARCVSRRARPPRRGCSRTSTPCSTRALPSSTTCRGAPGKTSPTTWCTSWRSTATFLA